MAEVDFRVTEPKRPELKEMMLRFESLGMNCELGLIQRHNSAEPVSLCRFGQIPFRGLVAALENRMEEIGHPDFLTLSEGFGREWWASIEKYRFVFHTALSMNLVAEQEAFDRVSTHFTYLARKLTEDLGSGGKMFVYRAETGAPSFDRARWLRQTMGRFGDPCLLWVSLAKGREQVGTVEWIDEGKLMVGYLDRFTPLHFAAGASVRVWLQILAAALRLKGEFDPAWDEQMALI